MASPKKLSHIVVIGFTAGASRRSRPTNVFKNIEVSWSSGQRLPAARVAQVAVCR